MNDTLANANTTNTLTSAATLVGRILLALIFVQAGISKLSAPAGTVAQMGSHGVPFASVLVWGAIALELIGGLMLMAGLLTRWVALALCLYTLALALIFHAYWAAPAAAARAQHAFFYGHLSMMGGLLVVAAFGAGAWSLDALLNRQLRSPVFA